MSRYELPEHPDHPLPPARPERRQPEIWHPSPTPESAEVDDLQALFGYLRILWNHKGTLAICSVAALLLALGASLLMTPVYRAGLNMEIQGFQEPLSTPMSTENATLATHAQLLTSRAMRTRAFDAVQARNSEPAELPVTQGALAWLRSSLGLADPMEFWPWEEALLYASGSLEIVPPADGSMIVTVITESPNPMAARLYVNTLAEEYIQRIQEERWAAYENAGDFLTQAANDQKVKLEQAQQALADFARSRGLVFTGETTSITQDSLRLTQAELAAATADRIALESRYQASISSPTEALPEVLDSGPMASYQVQLADLRRLHAQLSTTLTPAHFRVREIQSQIEALEATQQRERENIRARAQVEYETALRRERQLQQNYETQARLLSDQSEMLMTYEVLRRDVETNQALYESMLLRGREANVASSMRPGGARIIDFAGLSTAPSSPNLVLNLALGLIGGFGLGAVVAIFRSRSDTRIQMPGRLTPFLQVRELGVIPSAKADPAVKALSRRAGRGRAVNGSAGGLNPEDSLELVAWTRKPSFFADSVRSAMTSILYSGENGDRPRVLLITSPNPQEGKSTITTNLAVTLAEINQRVLLVDGDLRRPRVHDIFDVPNTFGLSDVLHERTPIEDYEDETLIRKTRIPGLSVLPAGPGRASVTPLLHSDRMRNLIARMRGQFDIVLIDAAPVLSVPDARVLARVADAVVLVFRAHSTTEESALAAARCFNEDGTPILGTILNDWNPSAGGSYASYYNVYHSPYHQN